MDGWLFIVDLFRALIFSAAQLFGGSVGSGILAASILVRLALLPLTLRVARRMRAHQEQMAKLAPEIETLRKRYGRDRARLAEAMSALFRKRGIDPFPRGVVSSMLVQLPVSIALYDAVANGVGRGVKYLWIRDLAKPDALVAVAAALLAGIAASGSGTPAAKATILVSASITLFIAWRLSAGVGLYWVASSAISVVQMLFLRKTAAVRAAV